MAFQTGISNCISNSHVKLHLHICTTTWHFKLHSKLDALKILVAYLDVQERRRTLVDSQVINVTDYDQLDWVERALLVGQVLSKGQQALLERAKKGTKH